MRQLVSNNGVTLKSGLEVTQCSLYKNDRGLPLESLGAVYSNDGRTFSRFDERDSQPPIKQTKRYRTLAVLMHIIAQQKWLSTTIRVELAMQNTNNKKKKNNVKTVLKK